MASVTCDGPPTSPGDAGTVSGVGEESLDGDDGMDGEDAGYEGDEELEDEM